MNAHAAITKRETKLDDGRVDALSFVKKSRKGGYNYWADVPSAGKYTLDCAIGAKLAGEFLNFLGRFPTYGNGTLLGSIMLSMEENYATRGHKIGFMNRLNKAAMAAAAIANDFPELKEEPIDRATRLAFELAETLNTYLDGRAMAAVFPTERRPEFPVGFLFLHDSYTEDELRDTIRKYRAGVEEAKRRKQEITVENEESIILESYGKHLASLERWNKPAATREGAVEALKLMADLDVFEDPIGEVMRLAVLRYLEAVEGMVA